MDELVSILSNQLGVDADVPQPSRFSHLAGRPPPNDQHERRQKQLELQKLKRIEKFNERRALLGDDDDGSGNLSKTRSNKQNHNDVDIHDMETNNERTTKQTQTQGECTSQVPQYVACNFNPFSSSAINSHFRNRLMCSEWMMDVPQDLKENWCVKPCPQGRRLLVVAAKKQTVAYDKAGRLVAVFPSLFPGGNSHKRQCLTILDTVFNYDKKTYYVLDVLHWNNQSFEDCDTEFRFTWLRDRFTELPNVESRGKNNKFPFKLLKTWNCSPESLHELMSVYPLFEDGTSLDGLLFYHNQCHYIPGETPLVAWLKPFMLQEMLGISIAEEYALETPPEYLNQEKYIENFNEDRKKRLKLMNRGKSKGVKAANAAKAGNDIEMDTEALS